MLASDQQPGISWIPVSALLAVAMVCASSAFGQVIVPASDIAGAVHNPAAVVQPADAEQLLKDARSAMGVRNYALASSLINQAAEDPNAGQLPYTPMAARQELQMWMQRDGQVATTAPVTEKLSDGIAEKSAAATGGTMSEDQILSMLGALLRARQALAHGDVESAQAVIATVADQKMEFSEVGDSPRILEAMIQRQNELAAMAQNRDTGYNDAAASFLLTQAEALIHYDDFETATLLIDQAKMFPVKADSLGRTPSQLEDLIAQAKTQAATEASVNDVAATAKAQTASLMSQAQLAIAQEKWGEARDLINLAKAQNVPDNQFAADELRPWQLELKVQNELNRTGVSTKLTDTLDEGVVQASAKADSTAAVIQASYDPDTDQTRNVQVTALESEADALLANASKKFEPIPNRGMQLYRSGLDAMDRADKSKAREYFSLAWQFEDQLDTETRQSIQDQLLRLKESADVVKTAVPAIPASAPKDDTIDLDAVRSEQQAVYRRLQSEVLKQRASAERLLEENPREALETMATLRNRIAQSNLDRDSQRPLLVSIDRNISEMQGYIEKNLPEIENKELNSDRKEKVELRAERRIETEKQLQKLVEDYNELMDQERFAEAEVVVRQVNDLAPDSEIAAVLTEKSKARIRTAKLKSIQAAKESGNYSILEDINEDMIHQDYDTPLQFGNPDEFAKMSDARLNRANSRNFNSESERRIWNTLRNEKVQGEYRGTLAEAVYQLAQQTGINIVFDDMALRAEGIEKDMLIEQSFVAPISLKSALDIILGSTGLVHVIDNEVIKVTSRMAQQSNLVTKTYYIGDLVMPSTGSTNPFHMRQMNPTSNMQPGGVMNVSHQSPVVPGGGSPVAMAQQIGGQAAGNPFGGFGYGNNGGPQAGNPAMNNMGGRQLGGITVQDFQPLMDLIQSTVQTESWADTGTGLGTIEAFAPNLSLIVSQTQEIQDEIQDLLKKLRELNDVQIVIEVRFMILSDDFFERVGVDFDFGLRANNGQNDGTSKSVVVGNTGGIAGGDVLFGQDSFSASVPAIAGFNGGSAAANFGFAILSDIEVFFLIQATKGSTRSSVMQAPTVTMFNGQSASVSDGSSRPFVTSVIPVVGDFAVGQQPIITLIPDGTNLSVQAVVSDDRRFVRLNLSPFFSEITDVQTFTFDGSSSTERSTNSILDDLLDLVDGGANADDGDDELQTVNSGVTVQQPVVSFTSVNTVVSVPDGGTVLMGGIKRMSEERRENGVPLLSNVPYVNRLFKNVSIGQETSNLMMMVTPRILIQEELEEDQVGTIRN